MGWFYAALGFLGINLFTLFVPAIPDSLLRLVGLVMLLTWYFTLGKKQLQFVKSTWGNQDPRKPWKKPLLIGFGCFVAYLVVGIVIAVIAELLFGIK